MNSPAEQPNIADAVHDSLVTGERLHPQIQFIYGSHGTEEEAQQLVEQLQPYNVVAVELVADPIQRQASQTFANQVTHAKSSQEVNDLLGDEGAILSSRNVFNYSLLRGLAQSQKQVIFIDADPSQPFIQRPRELARDLLKELPKQPPQEILGHLKQLIEAETQRDAAREELVADQVIMIAETLSPDDRLAVFQGAFHTPTFIRLKRAGLPVERTIINQLDDSGRNGVKIVYKGKQRANRQLSMTNRPISDEAWDRLLIETYAAYVLINKPEEYRYAFINNLLDTIASMDKSQLADLLEEIDQARIGAINSSRVGSARSRPDGPSNSGLSELRFRRYLTGVLRRATTDTKA